MNRIRDETVLAVCARRLVPPRALAEPSRPASAGPGPATGLADSAALRATVFGTPPRTSRRLPDKVPLLEMDLDCRGGAGPRSLLVR